jgi:hypothetical protein
LSHLFAFIDLVLWMMYCSRRIAVGYLHGLQSPGGSQWWQVMRNAYSDDVRNYIDTAIAQGKNLPQPVTDLATYYGTGGAD